MYDVVWCITGATSIKTELWTSRELLKASDIQTQWFLYTVKSVFNGHQRNLKKMSIISRCPLKTGSFLHEMLMWDLAKCPLYTGCPLNGGVC